MNRYGWFVGVGCIVAGIGTACTRAPQGLPAVLTGREGIFWDIVADQGRAEANITQGFCFLPDNTFYSYSYESGRRVPYTWGIADVPSPRGIAANLKPWLWRDSVLTLEGTRRFIVKLLPRDTIWLEAAPPIGNLAPDTTFRPATWATPLVLARSHRPDPDPVAIAAEAAATAAEPVNLDARRKSLQALGVALVVALDPTVTVLYDPAATALTGPAGTCWDVLRTWGPVEEGFSVDGLEFLPDGRFHYYYYDLFPGGHGSRTRFNLGKMEAHIPRTHPIASDQWHLDGRRLTLPDPLHYQVNWMGPDTVRLRAVERDQANSYLLVRSRRAENPE